MSKLYFRYGSMNAAKSASLLLAAHNYEELGGTVRLFNFRGDTRWDEGVVASRIGLSKPCELYDEDTDLYDALYSPDVTYSAIFVDEAQFLTKTQVEALHTYATTSNVPVLCYGLRTDFRGDLFDGSAALMAHAESIEELKTICQCGSKATHVARYVDDVRQYDGEVIVIGSTNYKSMCYKCWSDY